jgi:uncharacterized protein
VRGMADTARHELDRLKRLLKPPGRSDWFDLCWVAGVYALAVVPLGLWGGLIAWNPLPLIQGLAFAVVAVIVPALGEEGLFRGLLLRDRGPLWLRVGLPLVAFVFWHPFQALTFAPGRVLFFDPVFLLMTAILGLACTVLRLRSGTIWTAVVLHWLAVVLWQGLGQGLS